MRLTLATLMWVLHIRLPIIMKYQHFIQYEGILTDDYYTPSMNSVSYLMIRKQRERCSIFIGCLFLFLLSIMSFVRYAEAATTTATVEANIVSSTNLVAQNGIVFGDISSSSIDGTVTIDTDGSRTTSGGATVNRNTSGTPALYEVSGDPSAYFSITLPDSVVLTSTAGNKMTVSNFNSIPASRGQLDSSGRQKMNVGATLGVGSFQPFGAYSGVMATTIEYN